MKILRPLKAIRTKCLDCSAGSPLEVKSCVIPECPLHPWRFGKRPSTILRKELRAKSITSVALGEQERAL